MNFNQKLENLLSKNKDLLDQEGILLKQKIKALALSFDEELIGLLLSDIEVKEHFFKEIGKATIFDYKKFIDYIEDKNFLLDSYTKFSNKIGLTVSNKHLKQIDDVVLSFPFKDCILEGGQTKEDEKRKEIFFNEVLAKDEINRLLDKKVITNATKYYYEDNEVQETKEFSFTRDENGTIKDNLIIKGNNLLALHTLKSNFAGNIKLIYIDPPYNTGGDSFGYNDNFNHSTWLSFMKNRLEIARELLRDDGVIFISLDDKELHYVKVLIDEIFGRENFIGNIAWESKTKSQNTKDSFNKLQPKVEHILLYTKKSCRRFNLITKGKKEYPHQDNKGKYREYILELMSAKGIRGRATMVFAIKGILPPQGKQWKLGKDAIDEYIKNNDLSLRNGKIVIKIRPENETSNRTEPFWGLLTKDIGTAENAKKELTKILNSNNHGFETVKPINLIKRLIFHTVNKNDIVLDFHAGSGTTAHAVLELREKDKIDCQFILIEQMDYIHNVTVERIKNVIRNNQKGEFIYFELDKYNQKFIDDLSIVTEENILEIYSEITKKGFLNYDVELKRLEENFEAFKALSLEDKKEFLISILNKNMLYKNLSEIDDTNFKIDEQTKKLNRDFYNLSDKE